MTRSHQTSAASTAFGCLRCVLLAALHSLEGLDMLLEGVDIVCAVHRPEMKFNGIGALVARIKTDAGIAAKQLDEAVHQQVMQDPFLSG